MGTAFVVPHQMLAIQALIITAIVSVFFGALFGTADTVWGPDWHWERMIMLSGAFFSFVSFATVVSAFVVWITTEYVLLLQSVPPRAKVPVLTATNELHAVTAAEAYLGLGWAFAIVAAVLTFGSALIHCVALADSLGEEVQPLAEPHLNDHPPQEEVQKPVHPHVVVSQAPPGYQPPSFV
jgi:hypothetical protein